MNISLISGHSFWWILLFILMSFGLVYWQYFYKNTFKKELSKLRLILLASLRFLVVFFMLLLFLQPSIKNKSYIAHKPTLIFVQDNSKSILYNRDSSYYIDKYPLKVGTLLQELKSKYDVLKIGFGNDVQPLLNWNYNATTTNYSKLFDFLKSNYSNLPDVQVLLASDGIYNSGGNPRYQLEDLNFPIHTLQLGDTAEMADVLISSVKSNKIGFVNTSFPVRVGIKATNLKNEKFAITIKKGNKLLIQDEVTADQNLFYMEKDYMLSTTEKGLQKFDVFVRSKAKEHSYKNNKTDFVVDILNTKRNIAICYDQYHPDIAALRSAIEANRNFAVQLINVSKERPQLNNVNLLVFYQIPSLKNSYKGWFQNILRKNIPSLFVIGANSNLNILNQANLGIKLLGFHGDFQKSIYQKNDKFSLFELEDEQEINLENLPPLLTPMVDYQFQSENYILAYQKIKNIPTKMPLIAFNTKGNKKIAWIFGEGFWLWKLYSYRLNNTHEYFNGLMNKIIQYLAINSNRDRLIIKHAKDFYEGDNVNIEAELYNKSYQLDNKDKLELILINKDDKTFHYPFQKSGMIYKLSIPFLEAGKYNYQVLTGEKDNLRQKGAFIVRTNNIESNNLQAESRVLQQISKGTRGKYFKDRDLSAVYTFLKNNENVKPILEEKISLKSIINLLFIMIFIIILMILEWFLKKYWLGF